MAVYRERYTNRDVLEEGMVTHPRCAVRRAECATPSAIPNEPELAPLPQSVAPIYRKYWWTVHDAPKREWIAAAEPLVARYGAIVQVI